MERLRNDLAQANHGHLPHNLDRHNQDPNPNRHNQDLYPNSHNRRHTGIFLYQSMLNRPRHGRE